MQVIIKRGTMAEGKRFNPSDKPVEINEREARLLLAYGHAVAAIDGRTIVDRESEMEAETRGRRGKK